jgi:hypothetical protein
MARSNSGMLVGAAVVIGGLYFLMTRKATAAPAVQVTSPGAAPVGAGTVSAPTLSPGSMATTAGALTATNQIWANLTATTGPYSGYVNFPSGSQAAAGLLQWATDGAGNYYTQWAGHIYLVPLVTDDSGNYTAGQQIS